MKFRKEMGHIQVFQVHEIKYEVIDIQRLLKEKIEKCSPRIRK